MAGDAFLPRWLLKRGHRLVFSNGIIVLTVASVALLVIKKADVNDLVPLYAIGVFTAFTMAGFGMARYHLRRKEAGWHRRFIINFSAGVLTLVVVGIFAVVKFTEGAWLVVVLFVILVPALIRLNREYQMESEVLAAITGSQPPPQPHYTRRTVFVSWTASTWPRCPPCATRAACARRRCARSTLSSTTCGRRSCARTGRAPTAVWCSISSTSQTGG